MKLSVGQSEEIAAEVERLRAHERELREALAWLDDAALPDREKAKRRKALAARLRHTEARRFGLQQASLPSNRKWESTE